MVRYIIAIGDMAEGHTLIGPFISRADAEHYIGFHTNSIGQFSILELEDPEDWSHNVVPG